MFKSSIVEDLDRSLNIKFDVISNILEILLREYKEFFKVIQHKSGSILQIQLKLYNQVREKIMGYGEGNGDNEGNGNNGGNQKQGGNK